MSAVYHGIVRKGTQLLPDGADELLVAAIEEVGTAYGLLEQRIA